MMEIKEYVVALQNIKLHVSRGIKCELRKLLAASQTNEFSFEITDNITDFLGLCKDKVFLGLCKDEVKLWSFNVNAKK